MVLPSLKILIIKFCAARGQQNEILWVRKWVEMRQTGWKMSSGHIGG